VRDGVMLTHSVAITMHFKGAAAGWAGLYAFAPATLAWARPGQATF